MARSRQITSVNTLQRGAIAYPVTSDEYVFLANGRSCPYLNIRSRCIPLVGMRRLRITYDGCLLYWGALWTYYVIVGWTTREIWLNMDSYGIVPWPGDSSQVDKTLDKPYNRL